MLKVKNGIYEEQGGFNMKQNFQIAKTIHISSMHNYVYVTYMYKFKF